MLGFHAEIQDLTMGYNLRHLDLPILSSQKKLINGQEWNVINSDVDYATTQDPLWCHLSVFTVNDKSYPEVLLFDANSNNMCRLKEKARQQAHGKKVREILEIVNTLVNSLTDRAGLDPAEVEENMDSWLKTHMGRLREENTLSYTGVTIHMEELINLGILVCRHKSIIAAVLIADLIENGILPQGAVYSFRTMLMHNQEWHGNHAFVLYCQAGLEWICDPRWRFVAEIHSQKEALIQNGYGNDTYNNIKERLLYNQVICPLTKKLNIHFQGVEGFIEAYAVKNPNKQIEIKIKNEDRNHTRAFEEILRKANIRYGLAYGIQSNQFTLDIVACIAFDTRYFSIDLVGEFQRILALLPRATPILSQQEKTRRPLPPTPDVQKYLPVKNTAR